VRQFAWIGVLKDVGAEVAADADGTVFLGGGRALRRQSGVAGEDATQLEVEDG
jgi:hypothetical protein